MVYAKLYILLCYRCPSCGPKHYVFDLYTVQTCTHACRFFAAFRFLVKFLFAIYLVLPFLVVLFNDICTLFSQEHVVPLDWEIV